MRFPKWYSLFLHTDGKKVTRWWGLGLIGIDSNGLSWADERPTFWQCSCFKLLGFSATVSRLISRKWELIILHKNALLVCQQCWEKDLSMHPFSPHLELLCHQYNVECLCLQVVTKDRNYRYSELSSIPALLSSMSKLPKRWRRKKLFLSKA